MTPLSPPQFHQTWTSASIFWNHSYLLTKPTAPNITNPPTPHFFHAHNHPWALAFSYPPPPHTSSLCSLPSSIHEAMRDRRMERFTLLPFSIGCVSQSSVSVIDDQPKNPHAEPTSAPPNGEDNGQCNGKPRSSFGLSGLQKLIKSFKSLSQFFVVYEEDEEEEREMEIGLPTDVQHVGHIGWDGLNNLSSMKSWDRAPELLSLPSLSMRQFELSMAAQAVVPPQSTLCSKQAWP